MITLDDIAALPHGEGKAVAIAIWNRLKIVDKAFRWMAAEFDYSGLDGGKMYRAYIDLVASEGNKSDETFDEVVTRLEQSGDKFD